MGGNNISSVNDISASTATIGTLTATTVNSTTLSGNGSAITALNGSNISSGTVDEAYIDSDIARDSEVNSLVTSIAGSVITSGTVNEAYIDSTIARDSEVTAAIAALADTYVNTTGDTMTGDLTINAKLGVGTTAPSAASFKEMEIYATGNADLTISGSILGAIQLGATNGFALVGDDDEFWINRDAPLGSGGSTLFYMNSTGDVGIGTTSPDYKLDVNGSINAGGTGDIGLGRTDVREASIVRNNYVAGVSDRLAVQRESGGNIDTFTVRADNTDISDDMSVGGNITSDGSVNPTGIKLPGSYDVDTSYVGQTGNYLSFGDPGDSEDFIGYKQNTFYFKDSPGGGDTAEPSINVGGDLTVGGNTTITGDLTIASGSTITIDGNDVGAVVSGPRIVAAARVNLTNDSSGGVTFDSYSGFQNNPTVSNGGGRWYHIFTLTFDDSYVPSKLIVTATALDDDEVIYITDVQSTYIVMETQEISGSGDGTDFFVTVTEIP